MTDSRDFKGKIIVFTAPSGAGKTTIVRHLLEQFKELAFSVSATTRTKRDYEVDGLHYYFLQADAFQKIIDDQGFIEYEEVYKGLFYGTLKSELERLWAEKKHVVFDIDVQGAHSIKEKFQDQAITVFVQPPSIDELINRLRLRSTEDEVSLQKRMDKFAEEMQFAESFDAVIVNDDLNIALSEAKNLVRDFIA